MARLSTHASEFVLIDRVAEAAATGYARVGIGDDAAVLPGGLLIATDTLLEGVHFDATATPEQIGHKALAVNLSDIAAMVGTPTAATLALTLPPHWDAAFATRVMDGLLATAVEFGVELVGGDTTRWDGAAALSVTVFGQADAPVLRSGGRPGDRLFVTGPLGGSLASGRHLTFRPRVAEARAIAAAVPVTAVMDLSDGLSSDLAHLCIASGCGAVIDAAAIPRHDGIDLAGALSDGEDFELLIAADADDIDGAVCVGRLVDRPGQTIVTDDGEQPLRPGGWSHAVAD